jgi:predicted transcriptional regulator
MAEQAEKVMRAEHRTRSELFREALRIYISVRLLPPEKPTPSELRAIRRGEAAYRRGDHVTLDEYFRELARHPRRSRKKDA